MLAVAPSYATFNTIIFNTSTRDIADEVIFILNSTVLQHSSIINTRLKDGDSLVAALMFAGG
jgi:hypothetical protein